MKNDKIKQLSRYNVKIHSMSKTEALFVYLKAYGLLKNPKEEVEEFAPKVEKDRRPGS